MFYQDKYPNLICNTPEEQQKYLERQLQKLHPGCTITISPPEAALTPGA
jgi:hypothetical protein